MIGVIFVSFIGIDFIYYTWYLNLDEQLITGKNIPSKLKSWNEAFTGFPLNVNDIIGTVKSNEHPITSPFLINGSFALKIASVLLPPKVEISPVENNVEFGHFEM